MFSRSRVAVLSIAVVASLAGCVPGLVLHPLRATASKPSNVAVYFTVDTTEGQPVPGLAAEHFSIFEDGFAVSAFESKQTILNPKVAAAHYTLLLIDMSGSIVAAKQVDAVVKAASTFTERVEKSQKVAVYAFDGSPDLYPIVPFTTSEAVATGGVERLTSFKPRDPSTNLYGAVLEGIRTLHRSLAADLKTLKFGTLVVFTDGTDHANRVTLPQLRAALSAPQNGSLDLFAIGVGGEMDLPRLQEIGRNGTITERNPENMAAAFDAVAAKVEAAAARYYLLSYCTPARAGVHQVRILAHGPRNLTGELTYRFTADGFGPNCDPNTPTGFDLHQPEPIVVGEKKPEKKEPPPPRRAPKPRPVSPPSGPAEPPADPFAP